MIIEKSSNDNNNKDNNKNNNTNNNNNIMIIIKIIRGWLRLESQHPNFQIVFTETATSPAKGQ